MLDGRLYPRLRAAVHVDERQPHYRVTLGDDDLQFKGVPNALLKDVLARFSGREPLDAIRACYPEAIAPVVTLVASELQARRMLMLARSSQVAWDVEDSPFDGSIWNYVLDRVPDPVEAYRRWRTAPIIVSGHGRSFNQAVSGLLAAGAGHLRLGLDRPEDRREIENMLSDRTENEGRFRCEWIEVDDARHPDRPFVRVVDGDPFLQKGAWAARAGTFTGARVVAGVVGGAGLVMALPARGEPMATPTGKYPQSDEAMSVYAYAVLGNLAAFQALNVIIADDGPERIEPLPLPTKIVVRPDGGLFVLDSADRPKSARVAAGMAELASDQARSPHQRDRELWLEISRPFFAQTAPVLMWEDEAPLPSFPLAHRALRIHPGHPALENTVASWAVWPSEITALTIRKALETIADRQGGASGHAVALDENGWAARAYLARAEAYAVPILPRSSPRMLRYDDSGDVRFRTLVRLTKLYFDEPAAIGISMDVRSGAPRADVHVAGFHRFALGGSPLQAAIEALGRTLSGFQLGEPPILARTAPAIPVAACHLGLTDEVAFRPERLGLVPQMLDRLADRPVEGFFVGRFKSTHGDD